MIPAQYLRRPLCLPRRTYQFMLASAIALLANSFGIVMQQTPLLPTLSIAQAQAQSPEVSADEVNNYAASVLQMEGPRNAALSQIKTLLSQVNYDISRVDMTCPNTSNLSQIPRRVRNNVRELVVNYCNQAREIVENNGLSVNQFNSITQAHENDPALAGRIRSALIQLQQPKRP